MTDLPNRLDPSWPVTITTTAPDVAEQCDEVTPPQSCLPRTPEWVASNEKWTPTDTRHNALV